MNPNYENKLIDLIVEAQEQMIVAHSPASIVPLTQALCILSGWEYACSLCGNECEIKVRHYPPGTYEAKTTPVVTSDCHEAEVLNADGLVESVD